MTYLHLFTIPVKNSFGICKQQLIVEMELTGHSEEKSFKINIRLTPSELTDLALERYEMREFYLKLKNKASKF